MELTVLIVDDEKTPREILSQYIKWNELGVSHIYEAQNGLEALDIANKVKPSIIISDIKMPKMNGMELAQEIRKILPNCKFVFLSGYSDKEYLKNAIKLKAANYVEKPINLDEITEVVKEIIAECKADIQNVPNPNIIFFKGRNNANAVLNDKIYNFDKPTLKEFERALKSGEQVTAELEIQNLFSNIKQCEGTDSEYIRNALCQVVFILGNAAESRNALTVKQQNEQLLYCVVKLETLSEIEHELRSAVRLFFDEIKTENTDPITRLNAYLNERYTDKNITINSIAQALNFTPTYLCLIFKRNTGKTINQQITSLRIEKSKELLTKPDAKLYDVAYHVGYNDGKYFTKVFTKHVGISPKQYREKHCHEK